MNSVWKEKIYAPEFDTLTDDIKTDVLIIGGGITGILCLYMMKKAGIDCVLVEADRIAMGITGDTTAKITYQHGLIYDRLIRMSGETAARLYFEANNSALEKYRNICSTLDCDFEECNAFVYSLNNCDKLEKELLAYEKLGIPAKFVSVPKLHFSSAGAICAERQAQFHPLKFIYSIAKNLPIFENTKVLELKPQCAVTNHGSISAQKIIVATHFPFLNKHGGYFLKMYQHRSYVIALRDAPLTDGMYIDESEKGMSFRNCGDLFLLGGGSHRTGKTGGGWHELEEFAHRNYPDAKEVCRWATQDCMTLDGIPYIGRYSKNTADLYVAAGFNKWGMTSAMAAAEILTDMMLGRENKYASIFSPQRNIFHVQLAVNFMESLVGLLTPTVPRCPHLGCALKYNSSEHSWDCPCHGSRFTEEGKLINNPASDDKKMRMSKKYK